MDLPAFANSISDARIRLNDERWLHISEEHGELAADPLPLLQTIEEPERVFMGRSGELLATRAAGPGKWLVVVYREEAGEGFVITAFLTSRWTSFSRRPQVWPR